jgi:hypothetical protein
LGKSGEQLEGNAHDKVVVSIQSLRLAETNQRPPSVFFFRATRTTTKIRTAAVVLHHLGQVCDKAKTKFGPDPFPQFPANGAYRPSADFGPLTNAVPANGQLPDCRK